MTRTTTTTKTAPTITVSGQTKESAAILDEISKLTADGKPITEYFGTDIVPEGVEPEAMKLDELAPLAFAGEASTTAMTITMSTAASYKSTDYVVVLIGVIGADGTVTWQKLDATVVNGQLVVTIPASFMPAVANKNAVLAVLSDVQ